MSSNLEAKVPTTELTPAINPSKTSLDQRSFPTWHYGMMNDINRNNAIEKSISEVGVKDKIVFEIGTGAGLTAMLFAKYGARHVYTCEMDEQLQLVASEAIKRNGLQDKITVLRGSSTKLIDDGKINFKPDFVFSETLDCGVVGEGFYSIARDIIRIVTPSTVIMPRLIEQRGYMIESDEIYGLNNVNDCSGFDVSSVNEYATKNYFPVRSLLHTSKSLSAETSIQSYSYYEEKQKPKPFSMKAYRQGRCHGLLSYFHAYFGSHVVSNDHRDSSHWHQAFHPLAQPIDVQAGHAYHFELDKLGQLKHRLTCEV